MTTTASQQETPEESPATQTKQTTQLSNRKILTIMSGLLLGMLLAALDQTIVSTALPRIVGELGGLKNIALVTTAYLLASTVTTPMWGKLGDLFGRKYLFQLSIVIFLIGSALSGAAQSMDWLIAARAVQGLGAGGLMVLAQASIADVVPPRDRGRYQGLFGAVFGLSSIAGPLLGGFFTDNFSWRWVFYINVPIGIIALAVTTAVLPNSIARAKPVLDYLGFVLLGTAITCIVLITTWGGGQYAWDSGVIISLIVAAIVLLAGFVLAEHRAQEPVIPLHLFRNRTFTISSLVSFVVGLAMFGAIIYLPLYLQLVTGASATNSGLLLLPLMGGLLLTSIASGQVISRTGHYKIFPILGMALAAIGMLLLSTMDVGTPRLLSSAYMFVLGAGLGLVMQVMVLATQNSVGRSDLGTATAAVSFFRSVGGSIGVSIFGALFNNRLASELAHDLPKGSQVDGVVSNSISAIRSLPAAVRDVYELAYANSLTYVFAIAVPILLAGFVTTWFLKEKPMATTLD